jgi:hypothetical protein
MSKDEPTKREIENIKGFLMWYESLNPQQRLELEWALGSHIKELARQRREMEEE